MTSAYIGVVYRAGSDPPEVHMVVNPDYDAQLDDPAWTRTEAEDVALVMLRLPRQDFPPTMSPGDALRAIRIAVKALGG